MSRLLNSPSDFREDMLDGLSAAYPSHLTRVPGASGVVRSAGTGGRVSVVVGGGCGHYPAFAGLVGSGLAAGAVVGEVFTSPSAEQAHRVGRAADEGAGVLFSFGNYAGDVMNFGLAEERLRGEGVDCRTVLVTDDVASAPREDHGARRGIAGTLPVFKTAGAAADRGAPIDEVERLARHANARTATLGVGFAGCTVPGEKEPLFTVPPGHMEIGLGIHGEPGIEEGPLVSASELAPLLLDPLLAERPDGASGRVAVVLNGLGATKYEELFVVASGLFPALRRAGLEPVLPEVGEAVTSLDMAGCSLTLVWLDDELEELWTAPADAPGFRRGGAALSPTAPAPRPAVAKQDPRSAPNPSLGPDAGSDPGPDASALAFADTVRTALGAMSTAVAEHSDELGSLDAVAGDGDHGTGMTRGAKAALEAADTIGGGPATVLRAAAARWADLAGGTSGVLWGAMLERVADHIGDLTAPSADDIADGVEAAEQALARMGRCAPGDKTMLDALRPFRETLRARLATEAALDEAWKEAVADAEHAARATADLRPRVGRARPLADRSVGTPDPGAVSLALCLRAVAGACSNPPLEGGHRS